MEDILVDHDIWIFFTRTMPLGMKQEDWDLIDHKFKVLIRLYLN
jgi:hypothetical protein